MTSHNWFLSGSYRLLSHIDHPVRTERSMGIVIAPPFGWEDVCAYRSLRFIARNLAQQGFATLRFDLPGTGDSTGGPWDSGLLDSWIQATVEAMGELRAGAGVEQVAIFGVSMGAMIALAVAARGPHPDALILWGAPASGRAVVRELKALSRMELPEYADAQTPPASGDGLEVAGFLITPETQAAIEKLDFRALPDLAIPVMLISRDDDPLDGDLVNLLESASCPVTAVHGHGYTAMMAPPHETIFPAETSRGIAAFLSPLSAQYRQATTARKALPEFDRPRLDARPRMVVPASGSGISETVERVEYASGSLFGVLTENLERSPAMDAAVLFLNSGAVRHIGVNRMWVEAARRWAARGIPSLRIDFDEIGESDGEQEPTVERLYRSELLQQIQMAMDRLFARTGARQLAVFGLCSGGYWAFQAAFQCAGIRSAMLLNPRLLFWDPEVDRRRAVRRLQSSFSDGHSWRRLLSGDVDPARLSHTAGALMHRIRRVGRQSGKSLQIDSAALSAAMGSINERNIRLTFVFAEGEPLLLEMEEEGHLPLETPHQCIRLEGCGHTFRPLWSQRKIHELLDSEVDYLLCEHTSETMPYLLK